MGRRADTDVHRKGEGRLLQAPSKALAPGRAIHFIDIENLAGTPQPTHAQVRAIRKAYIAGGSFSEGDLVFIACSHRAAEAVAFGWNEDRRVHGRLLVRSGPNGADFALLEAMKSENLPERGARVVVASGDGIFTREVASLKQYGVDVTVVSKPRQLHRQLRGAASSVRLFDTQSLVSFPGFGEAV